MISEMKWDTVLILKEFTVYWKGITYLYIVLKMLLGPKRKSLKSAENTKAIGTKTSEGNRREMENFQLDPYLNSHFRVGYQTVFWM